MKQPPTSPLISGKLSQPNQLPSINQTSMSSALNLKKRERVLQGSGPCEDNIKLEHQLRRRLGIQIRTWFCTAPRGLDAKHSSRFVVSRPVCCPPYLLGPFKLSLLIHSSNRYVVVAYEQHWARHIIYFGKKKKAKYLSTTATGLLFSLHLCSYWTKSQSKVPIKGVVF